MSNEVKVQRGDVPSGVIEPLNTQRSSPSAHYYSRFDRVVLVVIAALVAGIGLTIVLGDRVGVTLMRVAPLGTARSTSRITIQFSEMMNRESVEANFHVEPRTTGSFTWNGDLMIFQPDEAFIPGEAVNVVLAPGAVSESGREVLSEYRFGFTVRRSRVAYLFPADDVPQNIWIADPADPDTAQQVTFSPSGIYDFAVSSDGSKIAFAENNSNSGTNDIKLLDLETGGLEQLTNCVDASCTTPVWRPDGNMIVYERVDFNSDLQSVGSSPTRLWVLDLATRPIETRPLFSDLQILGFDAQWSADGSQIALYDRSSASILVYDFAQGSLVAIESTSGGSGALSPDGTELVYPETTITEGQSARTYLRLVNLVTNEQTYLSTPEQGFNDALSVWRPDGQMLAIARRDENFARGEQVYLVDPVTADVQRLTDDPRYLNGYFWWDPAGTQLVIQRFPLLDENMRPDNNGRPEIWTLDLASGELTHIATNGFIPRWVP